MINPTEHPEFTDDDFRCYCGKELEEPTHNGECSDCALEVRLKNMREDITGATEIRRVAAWTATYLALAAEEMEEDDRLRKCLVGVVDRLRAVLDPRMRAVEIVMQCARIQRAARGMTRG